MTSTSLKKSSSFFDNIGLVSAAIFFTSILLFRNNIVHFFVQDDWFVLNSINIDSLKQIIQFFEFRTDIIYYRPVGMFMYFLLGKQLFGLNHIGYHLIALMIHFLGGLFVWKLALKIFKNTRAAFVSAILFSTAAFHYMTLSWLSLTWNAIGTAFFLLALIFYLVFKEKNSFWFASLSLISYLLSLASSELALVLPVFILLFEFYPSIRTKTLNFPKILIVVLPAILINLIYLYLRFIAFPIPTKGEYSIALDSSVIKNLFWYVAWLVNIPEVFKYHFTFLPPSFSQDPTFMNPLKNYLIPFIVSFSLFLLIGFYLFFKNLNREKLSILILGFLILVIGFLPVIFLTQHSFPYYLSIASIGIFLFFGSVSIRASNFVILSFILAWMLTSFFVLSFTERTHWIPGESSISSEIVTKLIQKYPSVAPGSTVIIYPSTEQIKQSLMDQNALQVIYNDATLKTIYETSPSVEEEKSESKYYFQLR